MKTHKTLYKTKKITALLFSFLLSIFILNGYSYANTSTTDIKEVKLRFCDDPNSNKIGDKKTHFFQTTPETLDTICFDIINEGGSPVSVGINFVDGALTADSDQKKACLPEGAKENFGQYVFDYDEILTIPAKKSVRNVAKIIFPDGYAGDSYGCITVHTINQNQKQMEQNGQVFQVFSRLGYFVDAFVNGDFVIGIEALPSTNEKHIDRGHNAASQIYKYEWRYSTRTELYNTGNITVSGDVFTEYSHWWFLKNKKNYKNQIFVPKQSKTYETQVPRYYTYIIGGPFKNKIYMQYFPVYYGDNIDPIEKEKVYVFYQENHKFFIPRGLIIVLLVLYIYFCRYQKKCKNISEKTKIANQTKENGKNITAKKTIKSKKISNKKSVAKKATNSDNKSKKNTKNSKK